MNSFKNKNIIVTGASKGLGKTISIEFEKLGSNIALIARSRNLLDDLKKKFKEKDKHLFYDIDLMNDNERNKCLNDIEKKFQNIDIIFHCLGGSFGINNPLDEMSKYMNSIKGNLGISIDINNKFIPNMKKNGFGNIIHTSSVVGKQATASVPYVTAKSSISGYVRTMGNYLANYNIILCGVLPGAFFAEDNAMNRFKNFKPTEYNEFVEKLPNKRMPKSEEYIEILKLLSSQDSKIFCGSMIPLDTGQGITF
tara:strand:- start:103 stop:861 length:759 start_codon:yes stop_codon:yes gene_type:complete